MGPYEPEGFPPSKPPDDGGLFGPNRRFYRWLCWKYGQGVDTSKLKYWMFKKELAAAQKRHNRGRPK